MRRLLGALFALALMAPLQARADVAGDCAAIAQSKIEATNLLSSTVVPARNGLPEYCRVLGFVRPAINFEIHLPTTGWNGKFLMLGCGGFCGSLDTPGQIGTHESRPAAWLRGLDDGCRTLGRNSDRRALGDGQPGSAGGLGVARRDRNGSRHQDHHPGPLWFRRGEILFRWLFQWRAAGVDGGVTLPR